MKPYLIDYIACPETGAPILPEKDVLVSHSGRTFPLENGIPILISDPAGQSNFDYLEHYRIDAGEFDYFSPRTCKASEHDERRLREYILSLIPNQHQTILDAGCGSAWLAKHFAHKGTTIVSMDISIRNVSKALELFPGENHEGVVGDALKPPFMENSFDIVVASEIIEHVTEPKMLVKNLLRVVRPGGKLIISTPYKEKIEYYLCIHCNKPTPKNAHLHSFDRHKLLSLCSNEYADKSATFTFGNKALLMLRSYVLLGWLPFVLWKIADKLANLVINKKSHIILEIRK